MMDRADWNRGIRSCNLIQFKGRLLLFANGDRKWNFWFCLVSCNIITLHFWYDFWIKLSISSYIFLLLYHFAMYIVKYCNEILWYSNWTFRKFVYRQIKYLRIIEVNNNWRSSRYEKIIDTRFRWSANVSKLLRGKAED